jgi:hypothetical protein
MSRVAGGGVLRAGFRGCAAALASHGVVGVGWGEAEEFDTATDDLEDGVNCAKRGGGGVGGVPHRELEGVEAAEARGAVAGGGGGEVVPELSSAGYPSPGGACHNSSDD